MHKVGSWFTANKLTLNIKKLVITFKTRNSPPVLPNLKIKLNGNALDKVTSIRFHLWPNMKLGQMRPCLLIYRCQYLFINMEITSLFVHGVKSRFGVLLQDPEDVRKLFTRALHCNTKDINSHPIFASSSTGPPTSFNSQTVFKKFPAYQFNCLSSSFSNITTSSSMVNSSIFWCSPKWFLASPTDEAGRF